MFGTRRPQLLLGTYGPLHLRQCRLPLDSFDTHLYVVGRTKVGKSKFLQSLLYQLITQGHGCGLLDPHSDLCDDLLAPEGYGEIIGGSQREDDYDLLLERIREEGLPEESYEWYLDLRRYGTFVHSGFGMGVERLVAWICGIKHIREAIPWPRTIYRLYP